MTLKTFIKCSRAIVNISEFMVCKDFKKAILSLNILTAELDKVKLQCWSKVKRG